MDENFPAPNGPTSGGPPVRGSGPSEVQRTSEPIANAKTPEGVACLVEAAIIATTLLLTVILVLAVVMLGGEFGASVRTLDNRLMEEGLVRGTYRGFVVRASAISQYPNPCTWVRLGPRTVHEINAAFIAPRIATPRPSRVTWFFMNIVGSRVGPNSALKLRFSDGRSAEILTKIRHGQITFFARNWQWALGLQQTRCVGALTVRTAIRFNQLWRRAHRRERSTHE